MKDSAVIIIGLALTVFICGSGMTVAQSPPGSSSIKLVPPPGAASASSAPTSSTIERPRSIPKGGNGSQPAAPVVIMSTPGAPYGGALQPAPVYRTKIRKTDPACPYCGSETRFTGYVLDSYENKCYAEFQCLQFTDHQTRNEVDPDNCN
ncbi:MAG: hypothetical protein HQK58_05615 [Deltaproteobacteria bacterium]|nr:hypothetical protein [Deltaproteobacteria bacterium]